VVAVLTTVRQIIEDSLGAINVLGAGESMTAQDGQDGLRALNQMIETWSSDGAVIYTTSVDAFNLLGGVGTYTMGPGGDIDTTRPTAIDYATLTQGGNIVTELEIFRTNVFSTVSYPVLQGYPGMLFINNTYPTLSLRLYPVPVGGLILTLYSRKPLSNLAINDTLSLPPGYEEALWSNLACRRAPFYERSASQDVKDLAKESLLTIKRNNEQYSEMLQPVDPALWAQFYNGPNRWFNIYGGF